MTVNNLSDHISLNAVDQGISKLNPKINDLKAARDIFIGMKALNDGKNRRCKIAPIAGITIGSVLVTAAVATVVALSVILSIALIVSATALLVMGLAVAVPIFVAGVALTSASIYSLCKKTKDEKNGLPGRKLIKYFNAFKVDQKWDNLKVDKNKKLCDTAVIDYHKAHNTKNVQLSELIKDLNENIKKAENDRDSFLNQKLMSKSNIVPLDVHDYIANFTLALAAK